MQLLAAGVVACQATKSTYLSRLLSIPFATP